MITATLIRGRRSRRGHTLHKGDTVELHQWCHDWFLLEDGTIISPRMLSFDDESRQAIIKSAKAGKTGIMFELYDLIHFANTGRFVRKS